MDGAAFMRFASIRGFYGPEVRENVVSLRLGSLVAGDSPPEERFVPNTPPAHVLVIDTSTSMGTQVCQHRCPGGASRLDVVKEGLGVLLDNAPPAQQLGLVTFDDIVSVPCPTENPSVPAHLDGDDASVKVGLRMRRRGKRGSLTLSSISSAPP
jgi:hypothetical protein